MKRGRPAKPSHLKLVTGNPGKRPITEDWVKPKTRSKPLPAPAHLNPRALAEWRRLAPELTLLGTLTNVDRAAFAAYCEAWAIYVQAQEVIDDLARKDESGMGAMLITTKSGNTIQNPLLGIRNQALKQVVRYAAEFGFTPASRVRVQDATPGVAAANNQRQRAGGSEFFDD